MDALEEYRKRGGLQGYASQKLREEFQKALTDSSHPLREAVEAVQRGDISEVAKLLFLALIASLEDETSALKPAALLLIKIPAIQLEVTQEAERIKSGTESAHDIPRRIIEWAAMEVADSANRNKKAESNRKARKARDEKPGGDREKRERIKDIWASGIYESRDACAEKEHKRLEMSYSTARKALRGTADPS
jgi:hypothetical protein